MHEGLFRRMGKDVNTFYLSWTWKGIRLPKPPKGLTRNPYHLTTEDCLYLVSNMEAESNVCSVTTLKTLGTSCVGCFCASVQISNKQPKEGMMYVTHGFKDFSPSFLDPIIVAGGHGREGK